MLLSAAVGAGVFLGWLLPLRALMNYHEEYHLFRWTGYYLREQCSSWEGFGEYLLSFVTQFFYWGWLGALVMALLVTGLQGLTWWVLCRLRIGKGWLYPLSFVPAFLLVCQVFIPQRYVDEAEFREAVEYDYLVRTRQWEKIVNKPETGTLSDLALWSTNYALAMRGQLADYMFFYRQTGLHGLLDDGQQPEVLSYFTLSNIFLQLGMVNNAERMAFDAKLFIPDNHKSGRLYRRLAETNLINGDYPVALKYLKILRSSLFYGRWANNFIAHLDDESFINDAFGTFRNLRLQEGRELIPPQKDQMLLDLVRQNKDNTLAWEYLLAHALLQCRHDKVARYMQMAQEAGYGHVPRAVQECLIGSRLLRQEVQPFPDFQADEDVAFLTKSFFDTLEETHDMNHPKLSQPPFSQTYWYYHSRTTAKQSRP